MSAELDTAAAGVLEFCDGAVWLVDADGMSAAEQHGAAVAIMAEHKRRKKAGMETRFKTRRRRESDRIVNGLPGAAKGDVKQEWVA